MFLLVENYNYRPLDMDFGSCRNFCIPIPVFLRRLRLFHQGWPIWLAVEKRFQSVLSPMFSMSGVGPLPLNCVVRLTLTSHPRIHNILFREMDVIIVSSSHLQRVFAAITVIEESSS